MLHVSDSEITLAHVLGQHSSCTDQLTLGILISSGRER